MKSESTQYKEYQVQKVGVKCKLDDCKLKCSECLACLHVFICNCLDALINSTVCKHAHLVQQFINGRTQEQEEMFAQVPEPLFDDGEDHEKMEVLNEVDNLLQTVQSVPTEEKKIEHFKLKIRERLAVLLGKVDQCNENDDEALSCLLSTITAAESTFDVIRKNPLTKKINVTNNWPANKNIEKQQRSYSTKQKRKHQANVKFAKAAVDESEIIFKEQKWFYQLSGKSDGKPRSSSSSREKAQVVL